VNLTSIGVNDPMQQNATCTDVLLRSGPDWCQGPGVTRCRGIDAFWNEFVERPGEYKCGAGVHDRRHESM